MEAHNVLIVVVGIIALISLVLAWHITEKKVLFYKKAIFSVCFLLIGGIAVILTGAQELSFMSYIVSIAFTVFGIISRLLWSVMYNLVIFVVSKIKKRDFKIKTIKEIERLDHNETRLWEINLGFTTIQLICFGMLIFTLIYDIIQ